MKRFITGILLLFAAAAILLYSDLNKRKTAPAAQKKRIAIFQFADHAAMDEATGGLLEALRENRFFPGKNLETAFFNAHSSFVDAGSIAKTLAGGDYDLVITLSTPALQAFAKANRDGRVPHVFCLVTDPYSAGVGLKKGDPARPPHITGVATAEPVTALFDRVKEIRPDIKTVGTVWNQSELCSQSNVKEAREACRRMGVTLQEVPVADANEVSEACRALVASGVEAVWIGGDNTVFSAIPSVVSICAGARIPLFAHTPASIQDGFTLCLGADYHAVGKIAGTITARILSGKDPAREPVVEAAPPQLAVNLVAAGALGPRWKIPASVQDAADVVMDGSGLHIKRPPVGKLWQIQVVTYNETTMTEDSVRGIRQGFANTGLQEGRDYTIALACAQGSMESLPGLFDAGVNAGVDLFMTVSTPTLQAALQRAGDLPVVFTTVADPVAAGAGKSNSDHQANVTGIYTQGAYQDMVAMLKARFPSIRTVGTLFSPAEASSVSNLELLKKVCQEAGLQCVAVPVNSPSEIPEAATALCSRGVNAVLQIVDNQVLGGFAALGEAVKRAGIPLLCFNREGVQKGAAIGFCRDYFDAGMQASVLAARIMRGELPSQMPFIPPNTYKIIVSARNARTLGLALPDDVLKKADEVIP